MIPFRFFIAGILFLSASSVTVNVLAQCSNRIELLRVSPGNPGGNDGSIEVRIITTKSFQAKLIRLDDADEKVLTTRRSSGTNTITFNNLPSGENILYKVYVDFKGEEKFLCQTKVLTGIVLTSRSN